MVRVTSVPSPSRNNRSISNTIYVIAAFVVVNVAVNGPLVSPVLKFLNLQDSKTQSKSTLVKTPQTNAQHRVGPNLTDNMDLLHTEILPRLDRIKKICGPLCEVDSVSGLEALSIKSVTSNLLFPQLQAPIDCDKIMKSADIDVGETSVPYPLPNEIEHLYSLNGAIKIINMHRYVDVYLGQSHHALWDEALFSKILHELENRTHGGSYGSHMTNFVRDHLEKTIDFHGARVLVIGSERPWVEAICLSLGAKEVVTVEYGAIVSTYPAVKTFTPSEFRQQAIDGTLGEFDVVVTYSSIEHSGLGRYGDALNPWGDLLAIARAWCVTKPGGALAIGVPTGKDSIEMNAHRVYGKVRWPLVTANWRQVDAHLHTDYELNKEGWDQPVLVFRKVALD